MNVENMDIETLVKALQVGPVSERERMMLFMTELEFTSVSITESAKLLRKALKQSFPAVKFSIRSWYAGIKVRYSDNSLSVFEVGNLAALFKTRNVTIVTGLPVSFQARFVEVENDGAKDWDYRVSHCPDPFDKDGNPISMWWED
jgi:hypothetical protein|tara:strand:- start:542 stop:976 length:435 start_codon:yes stop_codon:yes gene_type:complete